MNPLPAFYGAMTEPWADWQLYKDWQPDLASFQETLDGGQAFCWTALDEFTYEGVVSTIPFRVRWDSSKSIYWRSYRPFFDEADALFGNYIGTEETYQMLYDTLPWRSDVHLKACMEAFPDLRILHQPQGETLLGFLCSATKQIVQIKEMLRLIRDRYGAPIIDHYRSLPDWETLNSIDESDLRDCKFGFRAKNISKTATLLHHSPGLINAIAEKDYANAKTTLCSFPGVGEKVADCVLLFGYQKLEAFPVDTWIIKAMQRRYDLEGWHPKQIAHFGRSHFGKYAGLAQQFIFAWERKQPRK